MRFLLLSLLFLCSSLAGAASICSSAMASPPGREIAVVEFTDKTKVGDAILFGKYVVVHDDAKMATSEPCFYIYSYKEGEDMEQVASQRSRLVTSFHCRPVERSKAPDVVLTLAMSPDPSVFVLREIQLAGSTEGHQLP